MSLGKDACQRSYLVWMALSTCNDVGSTRHLLRHELYHTGHHFSLSLWQNLPGTLLLFLAHVEFSPQLEAHMENLEGE